MIWRNSCNVNFAHAAIDHHAFHDRHAQSARVFKKSAVVNLYDRLNSWSAAVLVVSGYFLPPDPPDFPPEGDAGRLGLDPPD